MDVSNVEAKVTQSMEVDEVEFQRSKSTSPVADNSVLLNQSTSFDNSIVSNDSISDSMKVGSNKKIKLSKEEREEQKAKREAERERVRIEKEKARIEKEAKQKEERERKEREAQERKEAAEKMKLERQQKKEAELQKREEEKRKKDEDRKKKEEEKEEEKRKKDEDRKKKEEEKEEEKRRKEEDRKKKEEEKLKVKEAKEKEKQQAEEKEKKKLEKSQAVLFNFLKKPEASDADSANSSPVKLATTQQSPCKSQLIEPSFYVDFDCSKFEDAIASQSLSPDKLYLQQLLGGHLVPKSRKILEPSTEDVIEEVPEHIINLKCTFLQFAENIRPAFFGRRPFIPSAVSFRNPLAKESAIDYDVESELEWDEGGPGESLSGDEEEEEKDDYEIDNEFFVPHGYLSDDEEAEEGGYPDHDDAEGGEREKQRSMLKEQTLMAERNHRFAKSLIPQVIGCHWELDERPNAEKMDFLKQFARVSLVTGPFASAAEEKSKMEVDIVE